MPSLKILFKPDQKLDMDHMVTFCREMRSKKFLGEVEISIICDEKTFQAIASEIYQCRHEDVAGGFSFSIEDDKIKRYKDDGGTEVWD